jgi:hypothetical protein
MFAPLAGTKYGSSLSFHFIRNISSPLESVGPRMRSSSKPLSKPWGFLFLCFFWSSSFLFASNFKMRSEKTQVLFRFPSIVVRITFPFQKVLFFWGVRLMPPLGPFFRSPRFRFLRSLCSSPLGPCKSQHRGHTLAYCAFPG